MAVLIVSDDAATVDRKALLENALRESSTAARIENVYLGCGNVERGIEWIGLTRD